MKIMRAALLAMVIAIALLPKVDAAGTSCESLLKFAADNTTVTLAEQVPAGEIPRAERCRWRTKRVALFGAAGVLSCRGHGETDRRLGHQDRGLDAVFRLERQIRGGRQRRVGRHDHVIQQWRRALARGYATTSTDTGHSTPGASFAFGHREKLIDYAYRSEHEMTVKAKSIINSFYGNAPTRSYFNGCSTGGRQALTEASRFPDDFDGIIAGAAANPKTHLDTWRIWMGLETDEGSCHADPSGQISGDSPGGARRVRQSRRIERRPDR